VPNPTTFLVDADGVVRFLDVRSDYQAWLDPGLMSKRSRSCTDRPYDPAVSRDLPPIASLRAFARAARTLSFKEAARELHVSASALSRQIQALEEHLGAPLFRAPEPRPRAHRRGPQLPSRRSMPRSRSFEAAQDRFGPSRPVRVSALESFSESWLVPNLRDFEAAHPEVKIELEATLRYADFTRATRLDVANPLRVPARGRAAQRADRRSRLLPGVQPRARGGRSAAAPASRTTR